MNKIGSRMLRIALATAAGLACWSVSEYCLTQGSASVSTADARVGRPLTPMSYAGVARRTTRRAAVAGAAATGAAAYRSGCTQVVDAYGRVYTRC
jgi:hypothetical protein